MSLRPAQTLLTGLLCFVFANSSHAQITIQFSSPTAKQVVDSNLSIQVSISSTYQINSVVATVKGRSTTLTYNPGAGLYSGTLSLGGLPVDSTDTLIVTAVDVNSNTQTVSERIIYDPPPVLTLVTPYEGAVARPSIHLKGACAASGGHCQIAATLSGGAIITPIQLGTFTDSCNTTVDVSAYQGQGSMYLQVTGVDAYGAQAQQKDRDFYVETSPYLTPIYSANYPIASFAGNKVLIIDNLSFLDSPRIANITTGAVTAIPFRGAANFTNGAYVTTPGAVFVGQWANQASRPTGVETLYDWNNGHLDSIPSSEYGGTLQKANGNYCIWNGPNGSLWYRNLVTQTTTQIPMGYGEVGGLTDVTASGVAAYYSYAGGRYDSILLYQNGVSTPLQTNNTGNLLSNPLTDGANAAYVQGDQSGDHFIYRYDAKTATNSLLGNLGTSIFLSQPWYLVNNGYTAYLLPDATSHFQAWLRDTAGNTTQASFFSVSSTLDQLASNGQVAYINTIVSPNGIRYIYNPKTAASLAVTSAEGKTYCQDSSWYLVIGNTLFGVNLNIAADKADSFAVTTKKDSFYTLSAGNFESHYHTSGSLMTVTFSRLPAHGSLTISGAPLNQGNVQLNQVIPRSGLSNLVYTPAVNFVGSDTVVWTGSNGFTTSNSALLVINVDSVLPTLPPAPKTGGLNPGYCNNDGMPESFKVTNMPIAGTGTTVVAELDGQPFTVAGNGTMTIQPWNMTVGSHTVMVIFSNSVGADTTSAVFQIVPASTPTVMLAANPGSTLTSSTQQVVLTATDVSGGGAAPLYTFAKDRYFTNLLQGPAASNTMTVNVSALTAGDNMIYVSMKTSDSCFTRAIGVDSVDLVFVTPPTAPQIAGLNAEYCKNAGVQQVSISNLATADSGVTVTAFLDGGAVTVSGIGGITIQPGTLAVGAHALAVIFTNQAGADTTVASFSIDSAVTPVVGLVANPASLTSTTQQVVLTASDLSGGGSQPLYTFAKDAGFSSVIQAESTVDSISLAVSTLTIGKNSFFVRMKTGDSCFTSSTAVDSIVVTRVGDTVTSTPPPNDTSSGSIIAGPNPFGGDLTIRDLDPTVSYGIVLANSSGQVVLKEVVQGQRQTVLLTGTLERGLYFLRLIDLQTDKVVAIKKLFKLQ